MKVSNVLFAALSVGMFASLSAPASAACNDGKNREITVVNRSETTAYRIRATNVNNTSWGGDIAEFQIPPGMQSLVDMDDGSCRCLMDLRAESRNGATYWEKYRVNVCSAETWTLRNPQLN